MSNRAELRSSVRVRLSEPSAGALWSDTDCNAALAAAYSYVGQRFPVTATSTVTVAAAATSIPAPVRLRSIAYVLDAEGLQVPRLDAPPRYDARGLALCWYALPGLLSLSRPVAAHEAGSWEIVHSAEPAPITNDTDDYELPDGLVPAIVAFAAHYLMANKVADDIRRGKATSFASRASVNDLKTEADGIIRQHRRIALGSSL